MKQVGILRGGHGAGECLVKMVVRVDQTGQHNMPAHVHDGIRGLGQAAGLIHLNDETITRKKTAIAYLAAAVIHRHQNIGVADEERWHEN